MTEKNKKLTKKEQQIFNSGVKLGLSVAIKSNVEILNKLFPQKEVEKKHD